LKLTEAGSDSSLSKLLFDTQALVMWITGQSLPRKLQSTLEGNPNVEIYVSVVSPWEFLLKRRFREIRLEISHIWKAMAEMNARLLQIEPEHINTYARLPVFSDHADPYDRMLIAQALSEKVPLAGGDSRFKGYPDLHLIWK